MSEWKEYKLYQLLRIIVSNVDKKIDPKEKPIRLCNYMDVYTSRYIKNDLKFSLGSVNKQELTRYSLFRNDVLITKDSETPDDIAVPSVVYENIVDLICGYHLAILRPSSNLLDGTFLMNLLQLKSINKQFANKANGFTRFGLTIDTISQAVIPVPPLPEQRVIADILTTIDEAIEDTEKIIAKRRRVKEGLMQDLFRYGLDEKGQLRSESTHRFKDSPLGRIPEEWEVVELGSLTKYVGSGITPTGGSDVYLKEGIKFIRSQNVHFNGINDNDIVFIDNKTHIQMKRSEIFTGDVLLNITGASIGRCCTVPEEFGKANVNQHVCAIRLNNSSPSKSKFLSYYLQSYYGQHQIDLLNAGGNREGLNYQQIKSFLYFLIDELEQSRIVAVLNAADWAIEKEETVLEKLKAQKRGLMEDLLTGKVRVTAEMMKAYGGERFNHG